MAFLVPNRLAATYAAQAQLDAGDVQILAEGINANAVISGLAVTQRASGGANMSVDVAAGSAIYLGVTTTAFSIQNLAIAAADSTNPRFDLIRVNSSGTMTVLQGSASATPTYPSITAGSIIVAAIYVPAGVTSIVNSMIVDKRVLAPVHDLDMHSGAVLTGAVNENVGAHRLRFASYDLAEVPVVGETFLTMPATGTLAGKLCAAHPDGAGGTTLVSLETQNVSASTQTFSISGTLAVPYVGTLRWVADQSYQITAVRATLGTVGSGTGTLKVNIAKNGTNIFANAQRPSIAPADGVNTALNTGGTPVALTALDYITVNVPSAATGAADLVVQVFLSGS